MISIRRILAPSDFSDHSLPPVRYAAELADKFGAELVLLHVVQDLALVLPDAVMPTAVASPDIGAMVDAAQDGLTALVGKLGLARLNPRTEVRVGNPAGEVVSAAADLKADLICIGTHGRGGLAHMLLGSVAEKIIRHAPCPILTVRPLADRPT